MGRMLEALKEIGATSLARPACEPVSPDELKRFGLTRSTLLMVSEPPQAPQAPASFPTSPVRQQPPAPAPGPAAPSLAVAEAPLGPALEVDHRPVHALSPLAEEQKAPYRELAGRVLAERSSGGVATMLFTSADEGEAKTSTLASLAVVLAEVGDEEIVAVDANLRSPGLAQRLGVWADRGLIDVVGGGAEWRPLVRRTSVARLAVLPAGTCPSGDGSLPEDLKLGGLLEALRNDDRLVLVDAASLAYPEVAPLSRLCDGTYLVVALGRTGRRAAGQAVRLIQRGGGRLLGCVLLGPPATA